MTKTLVLCLKTQWRPPHQDLELHIHFSVAFLAVERRGAVTLDFVALITQNVSVSVYNIGICIV